MKTLKSNDVALAIGIESVLWHQRLGHLGLDSLKGLYTATIGLLQPLLAIKALCEHC